MIINFFTGTLVIVWAVIVKIKNNMYLYPQGNESQNHYVGRRDHGFFNSEKQNTEGLTSENELNGTTENRMFAI